MAGTLVISTLSDGTNSTSSTNCIQGSAKAWVSFNGNVSVPVIRGGYNVGSVTKNGTGDFTVNFTTAMPDTNYSANVSASAGSSTSPVTSITIFGARDAAPTGPTVNGFRLVILMGGGFSNHDPSWCCASVFR